MHGRLERAGSVTPRQASQAIEVLRALASGWNEIPPVESVRETTDRPGRARAGPWRSRHLSSDG